MAIPLDHKGRLLDVVCPQGHIVSIVVGGEPLPVLYSAVRGAELIPSYALDTDGLAALTAFGNTGPWHMTDVERWPSVVVTCRRCHAVYTLDHADCMAAIALPAKGTRTPRITLRRVVAAKRRASR